MQMPCEACSVATSFRVFSEVHPHFRDELVSTRYTPIWQTLPSCEDCTTQSHLMAKSPSRVISELPGLFVRLCLCSYEMGSDGAQSLNGSPAPSGPPAELNNCACVRETCICCAIYCSGCMGELDRCRNTRRNTSAKRSCRYLCLLLVKSRLRGIYNSKHDLFPGI